MLHDYIEGTTLYECPDNTDALPLDGWLNYPTTSIILALTAATSFSLAIATLVKYNSVRVFNKKIRTANISNTLWIVYFVSLAARCTVDTVRYATFDPTTKQDAALFLSGVVLHGVAGLFLGLALNHQRKFRSTNPADTATVPMNSKEQNDSFVSVLLHDVLFTSEAFFYGAFFVYLVLFLLMTIFDTSTALFWLFLSFLWVQRSLLIVFTVLITIRPTRNIDGPSTKSKLFLGLATVLNLANDVPATLWQSLFPAACSFYVGTGVDFLLLLIIPSILFYFAFLRAEYQRNMEECIWTTVSQIQDSFDYRRF